MNEVDPGLKRAEEMLLVNSEQQAALADMRANPADAQLVYSAVNLVTTGQDFINAREAVEEHFGFRGQDAESRILSAFTASLVWLSALTRGQEGELEINELSIQIFKSVKERFAAHCVLSDATVRNLPESQSLALVDRMQQDSMRADLSGKDFASFRDFIVPLYFLKRIYGRLQSIDINARKEVRTIEQLSVENDGLFTMTRSLQKYGLKDVYVRESTPVGIKDWHVYDWQQRLRLAAEANNQRFRTARPRSLARFGGFENPLINTASREGFADPLSFGEAKGENFAVYLDYRGLVEGKPNQIQPDVVFDLLEDGQLHSFEGISIKEFGKKLGLEVPYEIMRARLLSTYADLVLPAYLVDDNEDIIRAEKLAKSAGRVHARNFLDLVVARLRLIQAEPEIEKKIDKAERDERKFIRRHEVVGFIRKLPKGHRASQEARDECRKDQGLELAEFGETYVRDHERGGLKNEEETQIKGHRSRIRRIGGSIITQTE